jgi:hypothetical protein
MDTLAWLTAAITDFRTPAPDEAPPDAVAFLAGAFGTSFAGEPLVDDLAQAVALRSLGRATLTVADPAEFARLVRGPAAYLRLKRDQLLILQPAEPPVLWPEPH